jgi:hypothetical protein
MRINYIFHEYFENEIPAFCYDNDNNVVSVPRNELIDERKLVFGPIVFRGTIAALHYLKFNLKLAGWPDLIWPFNQDEKIFDYSALPRGSGTLLNEDAEFTTTEEFLLAGFPKWIRSNSGNKIFSGGVFTEEQFLEEVFFLRSKNVTNINIVCASPKTIGKEWRFAIVGGKIISCSLYMENGEPKEEKTIDSEAYRFAHKWNERFGSTYAGNYVLDVCEIGNEFKTVEVNNLLTSGLYLCDFPKVMKAIRDNIYEKFPEKIS